MLFGDETSTFDFVIVDAFDAAVWLSSWGEGGVEWRQPRGELMIGVMHKGGGFGMEAGHLHFGFTWPTSLNLSKRNVQNSSTFRK